MDRLVDLATAYVTQHTTKNGKQDWIVLNADEKEMATLPKELTEKEAMAFLHFARPFELVAFNKGVQFQKEKAPEEMKELQRLVKQLTNDKEEMKKENVKLSNELDKICSLTDLCLSALDDDYLVSKDFKAKIKELLNINN